MTTNEIVQINDLQKKFEKTHFDDIKVDELGKPSDLLSPAITEGSDISCKTIERPSRASKYIQYGIKSEKSLEKDEKTASAFQDNSMTEAAEYQQEKEDGIVDNIIQRESLESEESNDEDDLFAPPDTQVLTSPPPLGIPMMSYTQGGGSRSTMHTRDSLLPSENPSEISPPESEDHTLSPLLKAVRSGDYKMVQQLLRQPATDVLRRDPIHGQCALHFAVRCGHLEILQALCNPDIISSMINLPDNRRNIALHLAAAKSRRMTKLLLEHKSTVDFVNCNNQTPLLVHVLSTKRDDPVITEMLLHYKANPNVLHKDKSSVLHVAVNRSLFHIACRLVKYGARLDAVDGDGKFVFEKLDKKTLRRVLCHISSPPVWIPNEARKSCMLCSTKFTLSLRRHHCRHCGRLCCNACSDYKVELVKFPTGFKNRLKNGTQASHKLVRVCKTCCGIMQERIKHADEQEVRDSQGNLQRMKKLRKKKNAFQTFYQRILHIEYDECSAQSNSPVTGLSRM